mmetsp:Transcript_106920/g.190063  ORF Transcript_106920/g.190063 Transcript_106920/m.190063 type:complete len:83 (+) Transcript_106920:656-904(+)
MLNLRPLQRGICKTRQRFRFPDTASTFSFISRGCRVYCSQRPKFPTKTEEVMVDVSMQRRIQAGCDFFVVQRRGTAVGNTPN